MQCPVVLQQVSLHVKTRKYYERAIDIHTTKEDTTSLSTEVIDTNYRLLFKARTFEGLDSTVVSPFSSRVTQIFVFRPFLDQMSKIFLVASSIKPVSLAYKVASGILIVKLRMSFAHSSRSQYLIYYSRFNCDIIYLYFILYVLIFL